jgi:hypothetical protein
MMIMTISTKKRISAKVIDPHHSTEEIFIFKTYLKFSLFIYVNNINRNLLYLGESIL